MIKRTIHISHSAHLSTQKQQLVLKKEGEEHRLPIEDLGVVVLEHPQITITHGAISRLLDHQVAVITCNDQHLPQGLMLPLDGHHLQQAHFRTQVEATQAQKDRLWQHTVRVKIQNQAGLLRQNGIDTENMERWANKVSTGDTDNVEGRAAAHYWKKLFKEQLERFTRGRYDAPPNHWLNYGYAILRALVARALVVAGLLPTLGYHHRNQYNAYCLADDLMEPYRPFVDELVLELLRLYGMNDTIPKEVKTALLKIPTLDVTIANLQRPLMVAVQQSASGLYKCYAREIKVIPFPAW